MSQVTAHCNVGFTFYLSLAPYIHLSLNRDNRKGAGVTSLYGNGALRNPHVGSRLSATGLFIHGAHVKDGPQPWMTQSKARHYSPLHCLKSSREEGCRTSQDPSKPSLNLENKKGAGDARLYANEDFENPEWGIR